MIDRSLTPEQLTRIGQISAWLWDADIISVENYPFFTALMPNWSHQYPDPDTNLDTPAYEVSFDGDDLVEPLSVQFTIAELLEAKIVGSTVTAQSADQDEPFEFMVCRADPFPFGPYDATRN